jgi:hypothetical protein
VDLPHLPAVKPGPQRRLDLDLRSGWLEGPARRLQRARVRALPEDLLRDGVAAGDRRADRAPDIGERDLPALNQFYVGVSAFDAPSRSRLGVDGVRRQQSPEVPPAASLKASINSAAACVRSMSA